MSKKVHVIVTVLVVTSTALAACTGGGAAPTVAPTQPPAQPTARASAQELSGTVWKWTGSLFSDGSKTTPDDPNKYLIQFLPNGSVSITADCNQVLGTYTVDGNQLTITPGPTTLVACPAGSLGDEFVRQLGTVSSYLFDGDNLVLEFKFDSGTMTFAPSAPTGLPGSAWDVVKYNNGKQAVVTLVADSQITLNFGADGTVSGMSGCNTYTGGYESGDGTLTVGPLAGTRMFCDSPSGVMDQEAQYLTALQNAATYEIAGDTLTIRDADGAMQVVATRSTAPTGLPGTSWQVVNYNNGKQAVVSLVADTQITLDFGADGTVSGTSGCNTYTGGYESGDGTLTVGQLANTTMFCDAPSGVMDQEAQYLAALQNAATYDISNNMLTIRDADGATQVIATP